MLWCDSSKDWVRSDPQIRGLGERTPVYECEKDEDSGEGKRICGLMTYAHKPIPGKIIDDDAGLIGVKFACCSCKVDNLESQLRTLGKTEKDCSGALTTKVGSFFEDLEVKFSMGETGPMEYCQDGGHATSF